MTMPTVNPRRKERTDGESSSQLEESEKITTRQVSVVEKAQPSLTPKKDNEESVVPTRQKVLRSSTNLSASGDNDKKIRKL